MKTVYIRVYGTEAVLWRKIDSLQDLYELPTFINHLYILGSVQIVGSILS